MDQSLQTIIDQCDSSRMNRQERYRWLRLWYVRGTDVAGPPARYNMIKKTTRLAASYLYAPESTRFSLILPADTRDQYLAETEVGRDQLMMQWRNSGADVAMKSHVEWSTIYGTTIAKLIPEPGGGSKLAYVDPGSFGVRREDIPSLEEQEAFCHWYLLDIPELERLTANLPNHKEIMDLAKQMATPGGVNNTHSAYPQMVQQIIVSSVQSQIATGVTELGTLGDDRPDIEDPVVELCDVWEKVEYEWTYQEGRRKGDTVKFTDWKVTTTLGSSQIMERRNPVLPWLPDGWDAEIPFVSLAPTPYPDYFWGASDVADLVPLQLWHEQRLIDIDQAIRLNLSPPIAFSGVPLSDEKMKAMRSPGGNLNMVQPQAKMDPLKIEFPAEAYRQLEEVRNAFNETAGVPELLQQGGGMGQSPRSGGQVTAQANIAVGRLRAKSLIVEDAIEIMATRMFHLLQRNDPTEYRKDDGEAFYMSQIPPDCVVAVSAHSASPVYQEDMMMKAQLLLKAGAIDLPTFVELVNPPMVETLRTKSKKLAAEKAKQTDRVMQIQEAKANRPARR
jgi:hypothetical protein